MIILPIITALLLVVISSFSKGKFAKIITLLCPSAVILTYFFAVELNPFGTVQEQSFEWLRIMSVDMKISLAANFINSLLSMTLLLIISIFSLSHLRSASYSKFSQSFSILFLLIGILSADIITFFISWGALGVMTFIGTREYLHGEKRVSKFSYLGIDNFFMFAGLLLLSLACSSTSFNVINEKIQYMFLEEDDILYWGFLMVSLAIVIRSSLFPFLFDCRENIVSSDPSMHLFRLLNMVPLGCILMIKMNQAMNIYFFSNIFFILGLLTSFIMLLAALTRTNVAEMLNLENGSMLGMVYALFGLGQASSALILFITFLLLKSSISIMFSSMSDEKTKNKAFLPVVFLIGAYIGVPGLTNFFPFLDAAWAFWSKKSSAYIYAFSILNGILYVKILSAVFNFKKISSSEVLPGKFSKQLLIGCLPGVLSLLMIFYCLPPNLASTNDQILKKEISTHLIGSGSLDGSMQGKNIVMIILFVSIIMGILLGVYFYVLKNNIPFLLSLRKLSKYINELINNEWRWKSFLETQFFKRIRDKQFQVEEQASKNLKTLNIRTGKTIDKLRKMTLRRTNVLIVQTFAMLGICLMVFLLGLGWKNFI